MNKAQDKLNEKLLTEFTPPTYAEWKEVVQETLKGKPFEKAMFTKTYEDILLKPIYRMEDIQELAHTDYLPGVTGSPRSPKTSGYLTDSWLIAQEQTDYLPEEVNKTLLGELNRGLTKVNLRVDEASAKGKNPHKLEGLKQFSGTSITTLEDLRVVLNDVVIEHIEVDINAGLMAPAYLGMFKTIAQERDIDFSTLSGCIGMDPIAVLVEDNKLEVKLEETLNYMACMTEWAISNSPKLRTIMIDTTCYGNSGASIVQELGIAFNTATLYVNAMVERGLAVEDVLAHIQFNVSVGSKFFMEIAKFRGLRILWSNFVQAYAKDLKVELNIQATTSTWNKTQFDPYVNVLRTATESFSAILGGVDALTITHLDQLVSRPSAFTRRIARNQQIILKEEVNLYKVIDPAGGSWYVESLTSEIAEKSWEQFQAYETQGGIVEALKSGLIQANIKDVADSKIKNIGSRKDVVIGTNMFANLEEIEIESNLEKVAEAVELRIKKIYNLVKSAGKEHSCDCGGTCGDDCACKPQGKSVIDEFTEFFQTGATIAECYGDMWKEESILEITPLQKRRATEEIEDLRKRVENSEATPKVFLANFGAIPQFKARADFAKGFFEVGALEVVTNDGFKDIDEMVKASIDSGAENVCICSTDKAYVEFVPSFVTKLKTANSKVSVILAGYPKDSIEAFKEAGVDEFIHVKANCFNVLTSLLGKSGVK